MKYHWSIDEPFAVHAHYKSSSVRIRFGGKISEKIILHFPRTLGFPLSAVQTSLNVLFRH
jgi:hypothetical protein